MIIDMTSKEEVEKLQKIGEKKWVKTMIKAVNIMKPELIIGHARTPRRRRWRKSTTYNQEVVGTSHTEENARGISQS
jgi:hypothetical protein